MPITAKQRAKLPASDFGDPSTRTFPVRNQSDLDSAAHLVGKAKDPETVKRRLIRIAKRKGLTIPDAWKSEADTKGKMSALVANIKAKVAEFSADSLSFSQRRDLLSLSLSDCFEGEYWLQDVYDTYVVAIEWDMGGSEVNTISYKINADYSVDWGKPQCVQPETIYHPVADPDDDENERAEMAVFNLASFKSRIEGDYRVYDDANLFKLGDYPDKSFSLSEIEAEEAVGSFVECPVNIHHAEELSNMFTGNLGSVRDLWVEGEWVKGEVAIPLWLDNQLTDDGKKLSAEWTLTDKRFVGLALTPTPRIDNAALMAAFKTFSTSGKSQPPVASKAATTGERKTIMPKISEAWENLKALFTAAGFEDDMTTTKTPAPTPAPVEDKEKAELATFKANIVNSKKQTVKASAIRALGQNTPGAIAAFATIDATDSLETLEAMNTTYESIAAKTMGINGGRQTTTGNDGAFSAEKLDNPDLMKKVLFALSNEEPIFGSALKTLEQKGKV